MDTIVIVIKELSPVVTIACIIYIALWRLRKHEYKQYEIRSHRRHISFGTLFSLCRRTNAQRNISHIKSSKFKREIGMIEVGYPFGSIRSSGWEKNELTNRLRLQATQESITIDFLRSCKNHNIIIFVRCHNRTLWCFYYKNKFCNDIVSMTNC